MQREYVCRQIGPGVCRSDIEGVIILMLTHYPSLPFPLLSLFFSDAQQEGTAQSRDNQGSCIGRPTFSALVLRKSMHN